VHGLVGKGYLGRQILPGYLQQTLSPCQDAKPLSQIVVDDWGGAEMTFSRRRLVMATLISPSVSVVLYSVVCVAQLGHLPRGDEVWLYWAFLGILVLAYFVTSLATVALLAAACWARLRSPWVFGAMGLAVGIFVAILLDLPSLNFARTEYYGFAASAGASTALVYRGLLFGLRRRPHRTHSDCEEGTHYDDTQ
jgi:hypothetical protein